MCFYIIKSPKFKLAFTLAEVLITLGVIGVVAAITIPGLATSIQKKVLESQIKADYAIIQQAVRASESDDISYDMVIQDGSDASIKEWFDTYLSTHLKVEQVCYNKPGCWHKMGVVKNLLGQAPRYENNNGIGGNIVTFKISNGSMFNIDGNTASDMESFGLTTDSDGLTFYFDANGDKKPNKIGKDIFILVWTDQGLVPAGHDKSSSAVNSNCLSGDGYFCLQMLVSNSWLIPDTLWKR